MTANQSRLLGVALLLSAVAMVMQFGAGGDAGDATPARQGAQGAPAGMREQEQPSYARSTARLEAGAYIADSKRISDTEEIQTVIIPQGRTEELDTRCIVYKNAEFRSASITCAGVLFRQSAPPS